MILILRRLIYDGKKTENGNDNFHTNLKVTTTVIMRTKDCHLMVMRKV